MKDSEKKSGFLHNGRQVILVTVILLVICGLLFPLLLTGLSSVLFPHQANGSLIEVDGQVVGAEHVGQEFTQDYFLWGRPSAYHYNTYYEDEEGNQTYSDGSEYAGLSSGSNNYAPSNPALAERVQADLEAFLAKNPDVKAEDIPTDLLTASGSGLDPDISPESAEIQVPRIAKASGLSEDEVREIIARHTEGKFLGIFGDETVNVLGVNIDIAMAMGLLNTDDDANTEARLAE
ncbi:MAG TPA: potassium-transporting ATPase subunit KdpC [Candidatus Pullichristensenella excrementipullorum]|nr:potassium-transporting ATPase subunit KdpC [Candidatus Pullichristensenella excrementipullorum]